MYYAILHSNNRVLAEEQTLLKCQEEVKEINSELYYITTNTPVECSCCYGLGYTSDGYDTYNCRACKGTGYSINFEN